MIIIAVLGGAVVVAAVVRVRAVRRDRQLIKERLKTFCQ
jgi:hypothetical protein